MCFGNPAKSLELARARTTPEQWARFEREFSVFCDIHGLPDKWAYWSTYDWARWAFFQGRQYADHEFAVITEAQWNSLRTADQRVADAKYTRAAIAMMSDEQVQQSLERRRGVKGELGEKA